MSKGVKDSKIQTTHQKEHINAQITAESSSLKWAKKWCYSAYGEYLNNLCKPYPEHLLKKLKVPT